MLQRNADQILRSLSPNDVVLDVGGGAHPFNRANFIIDAEPYEKRGFYNQTFAKNNPFPPLGGTQEFFTRDTWIQRDICDHTPFPFADKSIDFAICSHTLEDVRDPLWVCHELVRVAKAGYIEVPSRIWESCRGMERGIAGLSHHRWLIEIEDNSVRFIHKNHLIHNHRFSLPRRYLISLPMERRFSWLYWRDIFTFEESLTLNVEADLENFVRRVRPNADRVLKLDDALQGCRFFFIRASGKIRRTLAAARSVLT